MKPLLLLAIIVGAWPAVVALAAEEPAAKPDLAKAQTIVNQICAACHLA